MLRGCPLLLRIGAHVNPSCAGFGLESPGGVVPPPDLSAEPGFTSSRRTAGQVKADMRNAFLERKDETVRKIQAERTASIEKAKVLFSFGEVETGVSMLEYVEKKVKGGVEVSQIPGVVESLAAPVLLHQAYLETDHNMSEAFKQIGSCRGYERVREAVYLNDLLKKKLVALPLEAAGLLRQQAFNALLKVHCTAGYEECLKVPDYLYDRMYFEDIPPSMQTYSYVLRALGLTTRMAEFDALWSWIQSRHSDKVRSEEVRVVLDGYCEAERFLDVEQLFRDVMLRGHPLPDAPMFDTLIRSIYSHSRHAGGTIPASEEKKLIFIPTWMRKCGVCSFDLSPANNDLVEKALERWTFRRGLDKTVRGTFDEAARQYRAWNEGQRWSHITEDDINTSMIEAAVRRMRGADINDRMRIDVQKGGGRGTIYPPEAVQAVTRYDGFGTDEKKMVLWDKHSVATALHGKQQHEVVPAEAAKSVLFARRSATAERRTGGSQFWKRR